MLLLTMPTRCRTSRPHIRYYDPSRTDEDHQQTIQTNTFSFLSLTPPGASDQYAQKRYEVHVERRVTIEPVTLVPPGHTSITTLDHSGYRHVTVLLKGGHPPLCSAIPHRRMRASSIGVYPLHSPVSPKRTFLFVADRPGDFGWSRGETRDQSIAEIEGSSPHSFFRQRYSSVPFLTERHR